MPEVEVDDNGWPMSAQWPGMNKPLFAESPGTFVSVELTPFSGRWKYNEILQSRNEERRQKGAQRNTRGTGRQDQGRDQSPIRLFIPNR